MKNRTSILAKDDMRSEYDFAAMGGGVQGKYVQRYKRGTNLAHLDPDVAAVFKDDTAVNRALRSLIDVARTQVPVAKWE